MYLFLKMETNKSETAKQLVKEGKMSQEALEILFPESKESEDERIMKNIITFLDELFSLGKNTNFDKWSKSDCAEWIAWLKKQGEQNPAQNEEDEANLQFAIDDFQFCVDNNQFPVVYNTEKHKEVLASLKSLKNRLHNHLKNSSV